MKKALLFLMSLIPLYGSSQDISGSWFWQSANGEAQMEFTLDAEGTKYTGHHCAVFQNGDRIDCMDEDEPPSIQIKKTAENVFEGTISSGYSASEGKIKLTFDPGNKILLFKILDEPDDNYYLPKKAIFESSLGQKGGDREFSSGSESIIAIKDIQEQLQGTWLLEENTKSKLVFTSNKVHEYYEGNLFQSYSYSISETSPQCGENVPVGSKLIYIKWTNVSIAMKSIP